jgi:N-acetyl-gamma-glutamylphosphate reductase
MNRIMYERKKMLLFQNHVMAMQRGVVVKNQIFFTSALDEGHVLAALSPWYVLGGRPMCSTIVST